MKIQINGFDIEINTDETNMSIKVIDANGKELSNNTYEQSIEGQETVTPTEVPTEDQVAAQETPEEEATTDTTQPIEGQNPEEEVTSERFMPSFEAFKKQLKK